MDKGFKDSKIELIDLNTIRKVIEISDIALFSLYLKEVYRDLIDRAESNKKQGISRCTFYGYVNLPVLIADKLFDAIDKDNDGFLGLKEFTDGMNDLYYGTFKQSAKVVFNMYDFDKDGIINKEDVKILFSYLPLKNEDKQMESLEEIDSILSLYKIDKSFDFAKFLLVIEKVKSDIYLQMLCFLYEHKPFAVENIEACKFLKKFQESTNKVDEFGSPIPHRAKSSIFNDNVKLSSPMKSHFKPIHNVLQLVDNELEDFNLDESEATEIKLTLPTKKSPQKHSHKISTTDILKKEAVRQGNQREFKEEKHSPTSFLKKEAKVDKFSLEKSPERKKSTVNRKESVSGLPKPSFKKGQIFKLTDSKNMKPYYLELCKKDIYYYKNEKCSDLLGMHNLSGSYINDYKPEDKIIVDNKEYFPFSVIFSNKTRSYYCESLEETENWIYKLKQAIGYIALADNYIMENKTLGQGKFGLVKLGTHKFTGEKVAIKIIKKAEMTPKDQELVKSEIDIMKMCRHKNIVRLLDHYENIEYIFIIMEYLEGGTFANYLEVTPIDELSEKQAGQCAFQIAKALEYMHQFGIIHRDLKPENIMIKHKLPYEASDSLKIMDFGLSKILGPNERVKDGFGTLTYVAPEVLTRKPYNKHVDIWSLGVIVFYVLSGTFPFDDPSNNEEAIAKKIVFNEMKFQHKSWSTRSQAVVDFIEKATVKDMEKRAKISDLVKHKWFVECGCNK